MTVQTISRPMILLAPCLLLAMPAAHAQAKGDAWSVRARLAIGRAPHQISFDATGRNAWIALAGDDQLAVVDATTHAVKKRIPCAGTPLGVAQIQQSTAWASRFGSKSLTRFDPQGQTKATLQVGAGPSTIVGPLPSGHFLLSVERAAQLVEVDLAKGSLVRQFPTGKRPFPPAVTSDGRLAFVPNYDDGTLTIVDLWNARVAKTIPVGKHPTGAVVLPGDITCAVMLRGEDRLALVNTASKSVVGSVKKGVGHGPFGGVVHPNGRLLFVNATADARVSVLALPSLTPVTSLAVGATPILMAVRPTGDSLWVSCEDSNELWILAVPKRYQRAAPVASPKGVTEIAVMGMIHGNHRKSKTWGLAQVERTIRRYKPDIVCTEIPPDRWERVHKDYQERGVFEDSRIRPFPEYTDCLLPLQKELGFVIEPCAGWTQEMSDLRQARMKEFRTRDRWAARRAEYQRRNAALGDARKVTATEDPLAIHSPAYDAATQRELSVYDGMLNDFIGPGGWTNINRAHMRLVNAAIDRHPGQRILVMFGAGHKYWIRQALAHRKDVKLVDLRPYLTDQSQAHPAHKRTMAQRCRNEVEALHSFFQDWFRGALPNTDAAFAAVRDALAPDFEIVNPEGHTTDRASLLQQLRAAHGVPQSGAPLKIQVTNLTARKLGPKLWLVTYEEWHQNGAERKGRRSTAVLEEAPKSARGFLWRHVHETWMR